MSKDNEDNDLILRVLVQVLKNQNYLLALGRIGAKDNLGESLLRESLNLIMFIKDYANLTQTMGE